MKHHFIMKLLYITRLYQKTKAVTVFFFFRTIVRFFVSMWSLSHSFDYRGILRPAETGKKLVFDPRMSCCSAILSALGCCKHPLLVLRMEDIHNLWLFIFFLRHFY